MLVGATVENDRHNRLVRKVVAEEDLDAICATIKKMLDEVMLGGFYLSPGGGTQAPTERVGLLVGPGRTPALEAGSPVSSPPNVTVGNWDLECPNEVPAFKVTADIVRNSPASAAQFACDLFVNHLQINDPGGDSAINVGDNPENRYKNQAELTSVGSFLGWRGPYFNQFNPDPWGTRYSANVFGLHTDGNSNTYSTAVVCISFGADSTASTAINMPAPDDYLIGGDDIAVVLSAMGPF